MNELHHRTKPVLVVWLLSLFLSVNLFADEIPETEYDSLAGIFSNFLHFSLHMSKKSVTFAVHNVKNGQYHEIK